MENSYYILSDAEGKQKLVISGEHVRIDEAPYYAGGERFKEWRMPRRTSKSTELNALLKSRSMSTVRFLLSIAIRMSSVTLRSAVVVLCIGRKPDCRIDIKYVWVGGESFTDSLRVPYTKVIIFEEYTDLFSSIPVHDIALLKLRKRLRFTKKIQPIKLPMTGTLQNKQLMVVGRGIDETGRVSKYLKKADVIAVSNEECVSSLPKEYHFLLKSYLKLLDVTNVCAKSPNNKSSVCHGDSGSPLVSGDTLVGLVSFGHDDCRVSRPAFYVNVATYVPWIRLHTGL
ncbi:trypsin alpha-3-like [Bicyclus anynana]|uniref:Trypsin alpha-3-like n=1 Tax=Bicyclus anynana TaxID=110368 RepID=A0ABM3LLN2_BICAN|nr:trypsin alpha-3-like [Bicyclus anynana]